MSATERRTTNRGEVASTDVAPSANVVAPTPPDFPPHPISPAPGPVVESGKLPGVTSGLMGKYEAAVAPDAVTADMGHDVVFKAAQVKAPSLTAEFVAAMELDDEELAAIARGEQPPPPTPGPLHTADMYRTPAGYQQTPPGVPPHEVVKGPISR